MSLIRNELRRQLAAYEPWPGEESVVAARLREFVERCDECCERSTEEGHITGSAWVIDLTGTSVLLTHHRRLGRWLQPGGHLEGDSTVAEGAFREASEETGLRSLRFAGAGIFDLDVHEIPPRGSHPAHLHYDVRYLLEADSSEPFTVSEESHDLAWVPLEDVEARSPERSVMRLVEKTLARQGRNR